MPKQNKPKTVQLECKEEEWNLKNSECDKLLEFEGELMPKLLLIQIRERIVPIGELRLRIAQRFQVLQSSHGDSREKEPQNTK